MIRTRDARRGAGHDHGAGPAVRRAPHLLPPPAVSVRRLLPSPAPGIWWRVLKEVSLIAVFAVVYEEIRDHMVQAGGAAASHALLIVHAEQSLGLFRERAVQQAFIGSDNVIDAFNAYYGGTHFLIPVLVLAWLLFWHPAHYSRARTSLAVATGLAFVVFRVFPVAPPRLLPTSYGIADTLVAQATAASGHLDSLLVNTAGDQYASMPSVHVAWAAWAALAVYPVARHWTVRVLALAYPLATALVVVTTGNHYFLDVLAGAVLATATWAVVTRAEAWLTVRLAVARVRRGQALLMPSAPAWPAARLAADAAAPGRHRGGHCGLRPHRGQDGHRAASRLPPRPPAPGPAGEAS